MKGVTPYSGPSQYYFRHLLDWVIRVGELDRPDVCILDFGCGSGELKRKLVGRNVISYDVIKELSDIDDWREVHFDILVANQVFYTFSEEALNSLLLNLRSKNPTLELVVGISRQGIFNNVGKYIFGRPNAHSTTKIGPQTEIEILQRYCKITGQKNVLNLANVYSLSFN